MIFTEAQQQDHEVAMRAICQSFHKNSQPLVLKGGSAIKLCYGLSRFCLELDFDSLKLLNLEHSIRDVFVALGKSQPRFRRPLIKLTKSTSSVHQYRVEYGDHAVLKIEIYQTDSLEDDEIEVCNGILTYKINQLIGQKLAALQDRTAARDLHDIIFLYDTYYEGFSEADRAIIVELYNHQSDLMSRFDPAYDEDAILDGDDLILDLIKLVELVESHQ